jgi:hypothetical protein
MSGNVRTVAGTTDTILAADNGQTVDYTSATAVAVTVPSGLGAGFQCTVLQSGAGQLTLAGSGATLNGRNGLKSAGQHASVGLIARSANTFTVGGDTTP